MQSLGVYGLFPSGLGHFESTELVKLTDYSFGGTGSPKALVDLGIILFTVLCIVVGYKGAKGFDTWGDNRFLVLRLRLCCLMFISFGAGFLI